MAAETAEEARAVELLEAESRADSARDDFDHASLIADYARLAGDGARELTALRSYYERRRSDTLMQNDSLAGRYFDSCTLHPQGHAVALTTRGKAFGLGNWEGAAVQHGEPDGTRYRLLTYLHDGQRLRLQPTAVARGGERLFGQASAVGRIEKDERERLDWMRRTELGRVAAKNSRDAAEAERFRILPQQRARFYAVVDEQRERSAARERLDAERAGAGKQIEHACAGNRVSVGVGENVEQRLAQAVGGRPDRPRPAPTV